MAEILRLDRTQVTDAGVQDIQKALPNCSIERKTYTKPLPLWKSILRTLTR